MGIKSCCWCIERQRQDEMKFLRWFLLPALHSFIKAFPISSSFQRTKLEGEGLPCHCSQAKSLKAGVGLSHSQPSLRNVVDVNWIPFPDPMLQVQRSRAMPPHKIGPSGHLLLGELLCP